MPDDILTRIDGATGCLFCEGPLDDSPSDEFCSEPCQSLWMAQDAYALPETFADTVNALRAAWDGLVDAMLRFWNTYVVPAIVRLAQAVGRAYAALYQAYVATSDPPPTGRAERMERALRARQNRNTGPRKPRRPPRVIGRC